MTHITEYHAASGDIVLRPSRLFGPQVEIDAVRQRFIHNCRMKPNHHDSKFTNTKKNPSRLVFAAKGQTGGYICWADHDKKGCGLDARTVDLAERERAVLCILAFVRHGSYKGQHVK